MKLGTLLTTLAATTLVVAQPALAATRSASSLPAVGTKVAAVEGRVGSPIRQSEDAVGSPNFLLIVGIIGFAAAMALLLSNDNSFDGIDDLPDSP